MKLSQIQQHIAALPLDQKRSLYQWLSRAIANEEEKALVPPAEPPLKPKREVVKKREVGQLISVLKVLLG